MQKRIKTEEELAAEAARKDMKGDPDYQEFVSSQISLGKTDAYMDSYSKLGLKILNSINDSKNALKNIDNLISPNQE